ncbi:unnamed protein product [Ilex paraguariensis]|uniref:Zinc finger PHD-type domain-containing protein n=1 Tax=Ilex paraguariensis TaxID=185542 RepID=A0ABC8SWP9_9AQUA
MRTKITGGARARLIRLPPKPSSKALNYLCPPCPCEEKTDYSHNDTPVNQIHNNGVQNIASDTLDVGQCHGQDSSTSAGKNLNRIQSNISEKEEDLSEKSNGVQKLASETLNNGQYHDLASNTSAEKDFATKKSNISEQEDCWDMGCSEKDICIKCDKGSKVFVCSGSCCPIAVHEKCMGCPPRFGEKGNFYCPYCWYKQAIADSHQAREKAMLKKKALSNFLDNGMMYKEQQKQKVGIAKRKEINLSTVDVRINCSISRNRPDSKDVPNQSIQLEEDRQEERFSHECTKSAKPCKGGDVSIVRKQIHVLPSMCDEYAKQNNCDNHGMVVENQTNLEPIIACGDGLCCREEGTAHQFEMVEVGISVQKNHQRQLADNQHERAVQDQQQAGNLNASPVEDETTSDGALNVSTKRKRKNARILKENEGRRAEEEQGQEQVQEKQKYKNASQPLNLDPRGRSLRKSSSEQRSNAVPKEKNETARNVRQLEGPSKRL